MKRLLERSFAPKEIIFVRILSIHVGEGDQIITGEGSQLSPFPRIENRLGASLSATGADIPASMRPDHRGAEEYLIRRMKRYGMGTVRGV